MKFLGTIINNLDDGTLSLTDFPERLTGLNLPANVLVGYSLSTAKPYILEKFEITKKRLLVALKQINSAERAKQLKEMGVFISAENMLFEIEDGYFISDLKGCEVIDIATNKALGKLIDVITMPANDVWIVQTSEGELPVPAVKEFIDEIDLDNKKIYINMIDGLMDLAE